MQMFCKTFVAKICMKKEHFTILTNNFYCLKWQQCAETLTFAGNLTTIIHSNNIPTKCSRKQDIFSLSFSFSNPPILITHIDADTNIFVIWWLSAKWFIGQGPITTTTQRNHFIISLFEYHRVWALNIHEMHMGSSFLRNIWQWWRIGMSMY